MRQQHATMVNAAAAQMAQVRPSLLRKSTCFRCHLTIDGQHADAMLDIAHADAANHTTPWSAGGMTLYVWLTAQQEHAAALARAAELPQCLAACSRGYAQHVQAHSCHKCHVEAVQTPLLVALVLLREERTKLAFLAGRVSAASARSHAQTVKGENC